MKKRILFLVILIAIEVFILTRLHAQSVEQVGGRGLGPDDEIGTLNMMNDQSRLSVPKIMQGETLSLSKKLTINK